MNVQDISNSRHLQLLMSHLEPGSLLNGLHPAVLVRKPSTDSTLMEYGGVSLNRLKGWNLPSKAAIRMFNDIYHASMQLVIKGLTTHLQV